MSNCLDCPPCEDIYTDSLCSDTIRLKCIIGGIEVDCINILPIDTGDVIIKKLSAAICTLSNKLTGASGNFTSSDGKIITVVDGLITSIVED